MNTSPDPSERDRLQKQFLKACLAFEDDDLGIGNATLIRDNTDALEEPLRAGLAACEPLDFEGLEQVTPLGFAASVLSDLALRQHRLTGGTPGELPSFDQEQVRLAAGAALRRIVVAALDTQPSLRTTDQPDGDEFQCLDALCGKADAELIDRCLAAGLRLDSDFFQAMEMDAVVRAWNAGGAFTHQVESALADPSTGPAMRAALNRPQTLANASEQALSDMPSAMRSKINPATLDAALVLCSETHANAATAKCLIALGANPLGRRAHDPTEPSLLWSALKDSQGLELAALVMTEHPDIVDPGELHAGEGLLERAIERREDQVVVLLASAGARFVDAQSAQTSLVNACEYGMIGAVTVALAQGADVNGPVQQGIVRTPLITAGLFDRAEIVSLLLDKGADPLQTVRKLKTTRDEGRIEVTTDALAEMCQANSIKALHAAGTTLGVAALKGLSAPDHCPQVKEFLAAVRARGAIPALAAADSQAQAAAQP